MLKAVVKHSFLKGGKGVGKARAHINYIQYREGEDRGKGAREFFNEDKEQILGRDIKERLLEQEKNGVTMHKIILSPGVQGADLKDYTREMMDQLEREKGRKLDWYGIEHRNTDHAHVHVVVMGKDLEGGRVRLDLGDMKNLRQWGDRYLEREHQLERYLDREIERLLKEPERERELEYSRTKGDTDYERLLYGDKGGERKRTERDAERDRREWEQLDKDIHKTFGREHSHGRPRSYQQFQRESAGRLEEFHVDQTSREARERWQELAKQEPELAKEAQRELEWLDKFEAEHRQDRQRETKGIDIDKLADGLTRDEREDRELFDKVLKELELEDKDRAADLLTGADRLKDVEMPWMIFGRKEEERQPEPEREEEQTKDKELGGDDSCQTFEADRQTEQEKGRDEREDEERDRGDDMFDRGR
jgi:type IV secretory pathway VirD2 relaxase